MPKGDQTGPVGTGPRKGRMAGFCSGFDRPGYANASTAGGAGLGMGRRNRCWGNPIASGRGMRRRFFSGGSAAFPQADNPPSTAPSLKPEESIEILKHQSRTLKSELDAINKRLKVLASQKEEEE